MVKISRNSMISRRITKLKKTVKIDTQRLREDALNGLEELFKIAKKMAQSKKMEIEQRQMWARVAAYIAQVINSVASSFDEKQIDKDLDELERLVNEAKAKAKSKKLKDQLREQEELELPEDPVKFFALWSFCSVFCTVKAVQKVLLLIKTKDVFTQAAVFERAYGWR